MRSESLTENVRRVGNEILTRRTACLPAHALLVGLSGIDASGKGYVAGKLAQWLAASGIHVANLNVDGWLNLPHIRFSPTDPGKHFYRHGLRLPEMFAQLVLPLRRRRSVTLDMDYAEETAPTYRRHRYQFTHVDIILVEGIFLFKQEFRPHFDLAGWVDCSFATAMNRAIHRGQEGLPPDETVQAFETIYFPAQRIHFDRDQPRQSADLRINNDPIMLPQNGPDQSQAVRKASDG